MNPPYLQTQVQILETVQYLDIDTATLVSIEHPLSRSIYL